MTVAILLQSVLLLICAGLSISLVRLKRTLAQVQRNFEEHLNQFGQQGSDLSDLCAAAVRLDRRVMEQEHKLRDMQDRVETLAVQDAPQGGGYYPAIDRVKRGAEPEELVTEFGLSLSEANLLSRLYRADRR